MAHRAHENGPFKEFDFADWFCDQMKNPTCEFDFKFARDEGKKFRRHMRNTAKEQMVALRDMLDSMIKKMEEQAAAKKA